MRKTFLFLILFVSTVSIFAQPVYTVNDSASQRINNFSVLPDSGYTFNNILTNKKLFFVANDSLLLSATVSGYWLKIDIANPTSFAGQYAMRVDPSMFNQYYYYDANAKRWLVTQSGIETGEGNGISAGYATRLVMQANAVNTVYVKINIVGLKKYSRPIAPVIHLQMQDRVDKRLNILLIAWVVALLVLLLFFLSNLYLYVSLKDRATFHYLIVQVGAMLYISTYWELVQLQLFTTALCKSVVRYYNLNTLLMHVGIVVVFYGVVQLTRTYLDTRQNMPAWDRLLKYGLAIYIVLSVIIMATNVAWFFVEDDIVVYDNVYLLLLLLAIIGTSIKGYLLKLRAAGTFLLAHILPLVLMVGITLFHVLVDTDGRQNLWLPSLTVVSQAFVFSVALVARTRLIEQDLSAKEMEAQQLGFELREIALQHSMVELEIEKITLDIQNEKTRNELLTQRLTVNQRELAANALYTVQKNEMMAKLKAEIAELKKLYPARKHQQLAGMEKILQVNLDLDDDWHKFKLHFEQVNPGFFEQLQAKHPNLTKNDMRLCAYFHINLATKEIAAMLNITPASVRQAKMRLHKKMSDV